ncbi:50S ribosomal protein L30 [Candidatus Haliotispira prima]|uniref:Large ribosomal subunit protein uL30 n=1 Tax=Candidatus Haliotispira prima TaxID=3034016 RepID=A0ABY8MFX9_9SPIO|nr:50S ribosomal protein L30 [Candidatus Haliotispira prima]
MAQIEVTLKRSIIGQRPAVRKTAKALKLGKIGSSASFDRTPSIEGMVRVVRHLVDIKEL